MKTKIFLLAVIVLLSTSSLFAQNQQREKVQRTPKQMAEMMTARLKISLQLTPEQEKKVYELNLEFITKQQAMREKKEVEAKDKAADRAKYEERIDALLSPEQIVKKREMTDKRKEGMKKEGNKKGERNKFNSKVEREEVKK